MLKNGLFLMSLGFVFFMFSMNTVTGEYQWGGFVFAIILIATGGLLFNKGRINDKKKKEEA